MIQTARADFSGSEETVPVCSQASESEDLLRALKEVSGTSQQAQEAGWESVGKKWLLVRVKNMGMVTPREQKGDYVLVLKMDVFEEGV